MSKKDLKILLLEVLIGIVLALLLVRTLDTMSNELVVEEDLMSDQDFSFETDSSQSVIESTMSGADELDLEQL
jgi:hypothetical protein